MSEFTDELKRLDLAITLPSKTYFAIEEKFKDWQPPKTQQALPVVPEDVDKAIKYLGNNTNSTFSDLCDILTNKGLNWLNDFQFKDRRFGFGGLNNKLFILSHLAITGYTVEKEKLYLLKHIEISNRDTTINCYLTHTFTSPFIGHTNFSKGYDMSDVKECHFKQSEIDDMETGSYEQVAVTFEEVEDD